MLTIIISQDYLFPISISRKKNFKKQKKKSEILFNENLLIQSLLKFAQ